MSQYPENWENMGAIARHRWSVAQNKAAPTKPAKAFLENAGSGLVQQYHYYSELIKSNAQGVRGIPDHKERNIIKASYLNNYRDYLAEYMAAGETHDNNVLFYCLVWACDCEQWDYALALADYAVKTVQHSDIFQRDPQTTFADSVFKFANQAFKDKQIKALETCHFVEVFERVVSEKWAINDIVKARYYKLMGLIIEIEEPQLALRYYKIANQLKPDIGVKTRIKELEETAS